MSSLPPTNEERLEGLLSSANRILVLADPDTREVQIDFPIPREGILRAILDKNHKAILRFDKASQEQKAHHTFWSNGTQDRIDGLVKDGATGAGLRQTLKWLLSMRIEHTFQQTGWRYHLTFVTNREEWERLRQPKKTSAA